MIVPALALLLAADPPQVPQEAQTEYARIMALANAAQANQARAQLMFDESQRQTAQADARLSKLVADLKAKGCEFQLPAQNSEVPTCKPVGKK